jgi:hypothetical protein
MSAVNASDHFISVSTPEEEEAFRMIEQRQKINSGADTPPSHPVKAETYEASLLRYRIAHPDHTRKTFPTRSI